MNTVCSVPIAFACFVVHMILSYIPIVTTDSTVTLKSVDSYAHTLALCIYCACAYECLAARLPLYLACFTPVAPVASL